MGKLKNINWKGIMAVVLSAAVPLTLAGCSKPPEGPIVVNNIGYSNVRTIDEMGLDENRFAVLDVGDHDSVRIPFQRTKFEMCNEHGVCLGIVISSDSSTESEIYDDVEYAKSLVRDYEVKFPVYFNIDKIITNDNLNIEMKTKLIRDFLEKCAANNIYVALHGTDSNLCLVKDYCKITGYDALVVKDREDITYDSPYNVYEDLDGTLYATVDLEQVILGKGLNDSKKFANNGSYTISSEEELTEISLRCGMSVNEILEFNNLKKKDIEGTVYKTTYSKEAVQAMLEVWVAGGPQYSSSEGNCSKHQHIDLEDISEVTEEQKAKTNATIFQRTNIGVVRDENGDVVAGDSRDHLDINLGFVDYAAREEAEQANKFVIKEFDRIDWAGIGINAASAMASLLLLAGGSIIGVKTIKKKVNKKSKPKVKVKK